MNRTFLRQLLLSNTQQLLISAEGFTSAMMDAFPLIANDAPTPSAFFFDDDPPTYKDLADKALAKIQQQLHALSEFQEVNLPVIFLPMNFLKVVSPIIVSGVLSLLIVIGISLPSNLNGISWMPKLIRLFPATSSMPTRQVVKPGILIDSARPCVR